MSSPNRRARQWAGAAGMGSVAAGPRRPAPRNPHAAAGDRGVGSRRTLSGAGAHPETRSSVYAHYSCYATNRVASGADRLLTGQVAAFLSTTDRSLAVYGRPPASAAFRNTNWVHIPEHRGPTRVDGRARTRSPGRGQPARARPARARPARADLARGSTDAPSARGRIAVCPQVPVASRRRECSSSSHMGS
jgi:hypothetical protein